MLERVMGQIKPEAAYFTAIDGKRTGLIFFDPEAGSIPNLRRRPSGGAPSTPELPVSCCSRVMPA
jgi:hypothetical protein